MKHRHEAGSVTWRSLLSSCQICLYLGRRPGTLPLYHGSILPSSVATAIEGGPFAGAEAQAAAQATAGAAQGFAAATASASTQSVQQCRE